MMDTLTLNDFKSLYKDDFIERVKVKTRPPKYYGGHHVYAPVHFAEVIDISGDVMIYFYYPGEQVWKLFARGDVDDL
jgi:hypothetical protein